MKVGQSNRVAMPVSVHYLPEEPAKYLAAQS